MSAKNAAKCTMSNLPKFVPKGFIPILKGVLNMILRAIDVQFVFMTRDLVSAASNA